MIRLHLFLQPAPERFQFSERLCGGGEGKMGGRGEESVRVVAEHVERAWIPISREGGVFGGGEQDGIVAEGGKD